MTAPSGKSVRILIIEDNPGDARLVREYLAEVARGGLQLEQAASLASARDLLVTNEFDAALLDLTLPDSDGISTFRAVHALRPELAIVVLSGHSDQDLAMQAVQEGAQDYLTKGRIDGELLLRALRYAIERQRLERQHRDFAAMVSHELRNPLATIIGWTEVLRTTQAYNERAVNIVLDQATYLDRPISDLVDVAQLDARQFELRPEELDLVALARECVETARNLSDNHQLELDAADSAIVGCWDRGRIQQVLQNLITNAIKYSPDGGVIRVRLAGGNGGAIVEVEDHGIGLAPETQARLFSRFYRSEIAKQSRNPGLGLGLHISRSIVEAHGGTISAYSPGLGLGSTFTFRLPSKR